MNVLFKLDLLSPSTGGGKFQIPDSRSEKQLPGMKQGLIILHLDVCCSLPGSAPMFSEAYRLKIVYKPYASSQKLFLTEKKTDA